MKHMNRYLSLYAYDLSLLKEMEQANYYPKPKLTESLQNRPQDYLRCMVEKKLMLEHYVHYVEEAKNVIGHEFYEIVMRDFFDVDHWYEKCYNPGTYYRKRKLANARFQDYMDKFREECKTIEF